MALRAGDCVCFPAKHLEHRVTKVKSGLRKSLVFWVSRAGAAPKCRFDDDESSPSGSSSEEEVSDGEEEAVEQPQRKKKRRLA